MSSEGGGRGDDPPRAKVTARESHVTLVAGAVPDSVSHSETRQLRADRVLGV